MRCKCCPTKVPALCMMAKEKDRKSSTPCLTKDLVSLFLFFFVSLFPCFLVFLFLVSCFFFLLCPSVEKSIAAWLIGVREAGVQLECTKFDRWTRTPTQALPRRTVPTLLKTPSPISPQGRRDPTKWFKIFTTTSSKREHPCPHLFNPFPDYMLTKFISCFILFLFNRRTLCGQRDAGNDSRVHARLCPIFFVFTNWRTLCRERDSGNASGVHAL